MRGVIERRRRPRAETETAAIDTGVPRGKPDCVIASLLATLCVVVEY
jgi:hypothetical protein